MCAVMGILELSDGVMTWDGHPLDTDERRTFGYMPEERGLYPQMRLLDQVAYFARLHGLTQTAAVAAVGTWLERLGLREREHDKVLGLSHGNQQRAQLAVALVHGPPQLILDEPLTGLDPEAVDSLSGILRGLATEGVAVLFSSHQLDLVERVSHRVVNLYDERPICTCELVAESWLESFTVLG
jgi:ABC-2 type transport system ATP-binding protein